MAHMVIAIMPERNATRSLGRVSRAFSQGSPSAKTVRALLLLVLGHQPDIAENVSSMKLFDLLGVYPAICDNNVGASADIRP